LNNGRESIGREQWFIRPQPQRYKEITGAINTKNNSIIVTTIVMAFPLIIPSNIDTDLAANGF